jgi:CrcB protein
MRGTGAWVALALAGATGTLGRYLIGGWLARRIGSSFPWETCLVNVTGCLVIGALAGFTDRGGLLSPTLRIVLMIGLLGGFTTFSTFSLELFRLAEHRQWVQAAAYLAVTNLGGFAAVWAGYRVSMVL